MVWRQVQQAWKWLHALESGQVSLQSCGHCCMQERDGAGVFQMTGALLKMKAQTVLLQAACTD